MKIIIVQENGRNEKNRHMRECHSLAYWLNEVGLEASCWGLGHSNYGTPFDEITQDCDVIFCLENYNNGWLPDLSKYKKYKVFWSIDSHCELSSHVEICKNSGINLHLNSTPGYIKYFSDYVEKCEWFPNAVDTRWFGPQDIEKDIPLGFIGTPIGERKHMIDSVKDISGLQNFSGVIGKDYVETINRFEVGFNISLADDINYRVFETTACKVPLVTNMVPQLDQLYSIDQDILVFSSVKEMWGCNQWLKKDEKAREQIALNGYKKTINQHTYLQRAELVKNLLESA